jgi:redox-sensitive bicupin YhaK (pirin superfamily)
MAMTGPAQAQAKRAALVAVRPAAERGRTRLSWLDSKHSFSFGDYRDPRHMGFRSLRVINDDVIAPGGGFATHGHRDMEIVTYVIEGALAHRDSLGNGSEIAAGEVQRMTAGTGIEHSEFNASKSEPVHLLQVWILPSRAGLAPGYEQMQTAAGGGLALVASPDGRAGSLTIHQDAALYVARLGRGENSQVDLADARGGWVQVAKGAIDVQGRKLVAGDGAAFAGGGQLAVTALEDSQALLFDLA